MSRREKLFWLCAGATLIVLFLSIVPSHYEICDETENLKKEHCTSYQVAQFLWIKIPQFFDAHNWLVTALFAGLVTLYTWRLWQATNALKVSTDNLWEAGERQFKLIKAEFVSTHRPRLIVRHIGLIADHSPISTVILMGHDADASGGLSVVNAGGTNAKIVYATYRIYFSKTGLPLRSPLMYGKTHVLLEQGTVVKSGESKVVEIWDKVDLGPLDSTGLRDIRQFETEGWAIYVMGEIHYRDDAESDHFMGFCRERRSDGRFRAIDDPDYEYQD